MSTWLAGRKTLTPMSTSRPPLILRVTLPLTTSPSWYLEMTISQARMRWAFVRERTISPVSSSMPSSRTSTLSPGCGRRLVFPLVEGDQALGLVADVDDDLVADDLDDLARDDASRSRSSGPRPGTGRGSWRRPRAVTTAVSSSSLTSNSRSRLRSTMFAIRFDSSPAHRGSACWSDKTQAQRTEMAHASHTAFGQGRAGSASHVPTNRVKKEKPSLHARDGQAELSIINDEQVKTIAIRPDLAPISPRGSFSALPEDFMRTSFPLRQPAEGEPMTTLTDCLARDSLPCPRGKPERFNPGLVDDPCREDELATGIVDRVLRRHALALRLRDGDAFRGCLVDVILVLLLGRSRLSIVPCPSPGGDRGTRRGAGGSQIDQTPHHPKWSGLSSRGSHRRQPASRRDNSLAAGTDPRGRPNRLVRRRAPVQGASSASGRPPGQCPARGHPHRGPQRPGRQPVLLPEGRLRRGNVPGHGGSSLSRPGHPLSSPASSGSPANW